MNRLSTVLALSLGVAVGVGACSSNKTEKTTSNVEGKDGATGSGVDSGAAADPEPTPDDFKCILNQKKFRSFYLTNRYGNLAASEAVANDTAGGRYPVGTIIQLIPQEAMVKRHAGYSTATNDWEFFSLNTTATGTTITTKGTTDVINFAGLNCLNCHQAAEPQFDFVCELPAGVSPTQGEGCAPLHLADAGIHEIQQLDPRCGAGP